LAGDTAGQVRIRTGLTRRVGELRDLEWRDVDIAESRFRVRQGKTATARRWVAVPSWLIEEIAASCSPDDRLPERRVFQGFSPGVAKNVMARACKAAGIPHFHPHDLRHRYASLKVREGVPVTDLAAQLGHARKSMTLDTYSHVLLEDCWEGLVGTGTTLQSDVRTNPDKDAPLGESGRGTVPDGDGLL
jgi:integrase